MRERKVKKRRKRKTLYFFLGLPWRHLNTPDPPGLEAPRTQASEGPEAPCPSSHPQDLRVERGEDGPLPQVIWRHLTWSSANPRPPVLVPESTPPRDAVQSGNPEGWVYEFPSGPGSTQNDPTPFSRPHPGIAGALSLEPTSSSAQDRPPLAPAPTQAPLEPPPWSPPLPQPKPSRKGGRREP